MNVIRILPEKVASKIAAGEVIERPSSVVRELLDNSIDAGADRINIKIQRGGRGSIRISDNGVGMGRDDLLLCIERHATSKIHTASDLFSLKSLGFRGEALPSISVVSRMEITSRLEDQLIGYRLKIEGGKLKSIDETGAPAGTIVEVRDLFFNLPARRKFLRAVKTETDSIVDTLSRISLPFMQIGFRLDDAQKMILNLPVSENHLNRISTLMGRSVAESMVDAHQERSGLAVRAYLAPPDLGRSRSDRIFVYINRRSIRDRLITRAVMEGYGQRLMRGRYPQTVIFLEIDPSLVDINVHPTKQEVRFHQSQLVYREIIHIIEKTLRDKYRPIFDTGYSKRATQAEAVSNGAGVAEPEWGYSDTEVKEVFLKEIDAKEASLIKETVHIIGQLKDTYILCQARDGFLMIDQHAAHERIIYERLKRSYHDSPMECQGFLIPQKIELSMKDARLLQQRTGQLVQLGLEFEHFGGSSFLLRSVPSILLNVKWENFFWDLIPVLEDGSDLTNERFLDRLLTIMACHGAIRAGKRMAQEEMVQLLRQLEEMDLPTHCPHGRPVFKKFNFYEIERMFKRVV